jgi:excisionase family DNA binding protein
MEPNRVFVPKAAPIVRTIDRAIRPKESSTLSDPVADSNSGCPTKGLSTPLASRMSVEEIARRLKIGRLAVYAMLEQGIIPGIRLGRRWIITRHAYDQWERNCGMRAGTGLQAAAEVTVLN